MASTNGKRSRTAGASGDAPRKRLKVAPSIATSVQTKTKAVKHNTAKPVVRVEELSSGESSASGEEEDEQAAIAEDSDEVDEENVSEDDDSQSEEDDPRDAQRAMLAALEAHGRSMFGGVNGSSGNGNSSMEAGPSSGKKAKSMAKGAATKGWAGILDDEEEGEEEEDAEGDDQSEEDSDFDEGDGFDEDDGWNGIAAPARSKAALVMDDEDSEGELQDEEDQPVVETVVFGGNVGKGSGGASRADYKQFMSAKSSKMMDLKNPDQVVGGKKRKLTAEEEEDAAAERTNLSLDKDLHALVVNKLLLGADAANRPVDKRNSMKSRLLELADVAKIGEGSSLIQTTSHASHPSKIRSNILKAREQRAERTRADAQSAGSWVKGAGGLGDTGKDKGLTLAARKRQEREKERRGRDEERGLGMGIGRFKGGVLTLSKREIEMGSAVGGGGGGGGFNGKGKGKGGGGGKGKKKGW